MQLSHQHSQHSPPYRALTVLRFGTFVGEVLGLTTPGEEVGLGTLVMIPVTKYFEYCGHI